MSDTNESPHPLYPLPLVKGKIFIEGLAHLRHPHIINPQQGESKRGEASLFLFPSPSPFKERGIKGVR